MNLTHDYDSCRHKSATRRARTSSEAGTIPTTSSAGLRRWNRLGQGLEEEKETGTERGPSNLFGEERKEREDSRCCGSDLDWNRGRPMALDLHRGSSSLLSTTYESRGATCSARSGIFHLLSRDRK